MEMFLRSSLYMVTALMLHMIMNAANPDLINNKIEIPLILVITPFVISKIPLLGTKSLMESGMQPLMATLVTVAVSFMVYLMVKEIKASKQADPLSKFLNETDYFTIGGMKVNREFMVTITIVLIIEMGLQQLYLSRKGKQDEDKIFKALTKFFKDKCPQ